MIILVKNVKTITQTGIKKKKKKEGQGEPGWGVLRFREQQNQAQLPCSQDHTSQRKLDLILEALGSSLGRGKKIYFLKK